MLVTIFFNGGRAFAEVNENPEVVEEVEVFADDLRYEIEVDRIQSANIIGIEAIQQMQTADVFETLEQIPGLTIEGGLTTKGKSFSIRGFGSNEDVLVQIDGVTQNFEKYRAGTGVEIEPELLKEVAVFRGGTSVSQGAGYLGGVVQMETKDARDYLEDRKLGMSVRVGHKTNNDEKFHSLTAYALPFDGIDLLINAVQRKTNDLTRPNGDPFVNSDEQQESFLFKTESYTVDGITSYSFRTSQDEGIEPYDLVSTSSLFSNVFRQTEEEAHSLRFQQKKTNWDLDIVLGYIDKFLTEQRVESEVSDFDPSQPLNYFQYDIWNFNIKNVLEFIESPIQHRWSFGVQATREERRSKRKENGVLQEYKPQPSGVKDTKAIFLDVVAELDSWRVNLGVRRDFYSVYSLDDDVINRSKLRFGDKKIRFNQTTPSFGIDKDFGNLTLFARYSRAFRAPLVTQYFSPSENFASDTDASDSLTGLGICGSFEEVLVPVSPDDYTSIFEYYNAVSEFSQLASDSPHLLQANYFCGDVFRPEESGTREVGILNDFEIIGGGALSTKITYFDIDTKYTLSSLYQNNEGQISQPGSEKRYGWEAEIKYAYQSLIFSVNYSELNGERTEIYQGNEITSGLRAPPGDRLNLGFTANLKDFTPYDLQMGANVRLVHSRLVDQTTGINAGVADAVYKRVSGYGVLNIFTRWTLNEKLSLRLSINNVLNKEYQLRGFGGDTSIGNVAAGRDVRIAGSYDF